MIMKNDYEDPGDASVSSPEPTVEEIPEIPEEPTLFPFFLLHHTYLLCSSTH